MQYWKKDFLSKVIYEILPRVSHPFHTHTHTHCMTLEEEFEQLKQINDAA